MPAPTSMSATRGFEGKHLRSKGSRVVICFKPSRFGRRPEPCAENHARTSVWHAAWSAITSGNEKCASIVKQLVLNQFSTTQNGRYGEFSPYNGMTKDVYTTGITASPGHCIFFLDPAVAMSVLVVVSPPLFLPTLTVARE